LFPYNKKKCLDCSNKKLADLILKFMYIVFYFYDDKMSMPFIAEAASFLKAS
jgi:hypothetical protein